MSTGIQWTDETWNPVTGCTKVSEGCRHCYAEVVAGRFWGHQYPGGVTIPTPADGIVPDDARQPTTPRGHWSRPRRFTDVQVHEARLELALRWTAPRRVFVNSMSDLFHRSVPVDFIDLVVAVIAASPRHTFQVLTKRPQRARDYFDELAADIDDGAKRWDVARRWVWEKLKGRRREWFGIAGAYLRWPLANLHLGVSVEDQAAAHARIPVLLATPAAVRWVSAEPLLGPVDLGPWVRPSWGPLGPCAVGGESRPLMPALDWIVVGGESGPGARPCDVGWIRDIVGQCSGAGAPVFVKQLGAKVFEGTRARGRLRARSGPEHVITHSKGGDPAEWPADLRVRELPR